MISLKDYEEHKAEILEQLCGEYTEHFLIDYLMEIYLPEECLWEMSYPSTSTNTTSFTRDGFSLGWEDSYDEGTSTGKS